MGKICHSWKSGDIFACRTGFILQSLLTKPLSNQAPKNLKILKKKQ
jgi:hypothetical protein